MLRNKNHTSRGDTLIEVLFAIATFSLVAVGSLAIMNQGANTAQRSLEITLVRQQIDAQAVTLRYLNSSYITAFRPNATYVTNTPAAQWSDILSSGLVSTNLSPFPPTTCPSQPPYNSFILNTHTATFIQLNSNIFTPATTFSQVIYNGNQVHSSDGIWIEAVRHSIVNDKYQKNADYIDFNIRACWSSPGESAPATLGTIVRLYEPTI